MIKNFISILISILIFSACTSIRSISTSNVKSGATKVISSTAFDYSYFRLEVPDIIIMDGLVDQCRNGEITGLQTVTSMRDWFGIVQTYKVDSKAFCIESKDIN